MLHRSNGSSPPPSGPSTITVHSFCMKHICITYHMTRKSEIAETCITLPMEDAKAAELLACQEDCLQLREGATLDVLLRKLSILQGYQYAGFCIAEEAPA